VPRHGLAFLAGAIGLAGGILAAILLLPRAAPLAERGAPATTPPTSTTAPSWVSPSETRLGPAAVIPSGLQLEGGRMLFTYEIERLAPSAGESVDPDFEALPPAAPASFTLTYAGGTTTARVVAPGQAGWFDVPEGITLDQVESIEITSYWLAAPAGYHIQLSPGSGAWVDIAPGVRARILQVVEQAENRLVIVELADEGGRAESLSIAGEGRDWQSSSYSMAGGQRWTLDFRGETLPDPVTLVVRGVSWLEVPGGGPVDLGGISR
jgi:hypothetical protein